MGEFTQLLDGVKAGDAGAIDRIFELAYRELHDLAHQRMRRAGKITMLDTTGLVHECYLKLTRVGRLDASDRSHFMYYAARAMRSIAVDYARRRLAQRRGGGESCVTLDTNVPEGGEEEVVRVDEALQELAQLDERLVQVVEMKYFAGLTADEIAELRGVTERTVRRDWEKARLLLFNTLQES